MKTEREMLTLAAKAAGYAEYQDGLIRKQFSNTWHKWNPLTNSTDCAAMCARLDIDTEYLPFYVLCSTIGFEHGTIHDGTPEEKLKAWMETATMVAAKIGGMK